MSRCEALAHLDIKHCKMSVSGALMIAAATKDTCAKFQYLDFTGNRMGPTSAMYIGKGMLCHITGQHYIAIQHRHTPLLKSTFPF
jgi:hypothetical protein